MWCSTERMRVVPLSRSAPRVIPPLMVYSLRVRTVSTESPATGVTVVVVLEVEVRAQINLVTTEETNMQLIRHTPTQL